MANTFTGSTGAAATAGFGPNTTISAFNTLVSTSKLVPNQVYVADNVAYKALTVNTYQRLSKSDYINAGDAKYGGLKFDGSDETATILAAIADATATSGPGAVYIPPSPQGGQLITIDSIDLISTRRITIFGFNEGGPNTGTNTKVAGFKLKTSPTSNYMFRVTGVSASDQSTQAVENVKFQGLQLHGNYESLLTVTGSVNITTTISNTSATVASTSGLVVGMTLTGNSNIQSFTYISAIVDSTTITLSKAATGSGTLVATVTTYQTPNTDASVVHGILIEKRNPGADSFIEIDSCYIQRFSGDGVYADGDASGSARATKIMNCKFWKNRNGVKTYASDGWIENNDFGLHREDGVQVHNWTNIVKGNNVFGNRHGIWLHTGEASICVATHNRLDRNKFCGIVVGGTGNIVNNNTFHLDSVGTPAALDSNSVPDWERRYYNHPYIILPSDQNNLNSHIKIEGSGSQIMGNAFRGKASGSHITNMAKYDVELLDGFTAVIGPNVSAGRGQSSTYGSLGMGTTSRAMATSIFADQPCTTNEEVTLDSATATTYTTAAANLFNGVIIRTGTAAAGVTDTTGTASEIANLAWTAAVPVAGAQITPNAKTQFRFRYVNQTGQTLTLNGGTNVTISGNNTIANNSWRDFVITIVGSNATTIKNCGTGTL